MFVCDVCSPHLLEAGVQVPKLKCFFFKSAKTLEAQQVPEWLSLFHNAWNSLLREAMKPNPTKEVRQWQFRNCSWTCQKVLLSECSSLPKFCCEIKRRQQAWGAPAGGVGPS